MVRGGMRRVLLLAVCCTVSSAASGHEGRGEYRPNELVCEMLPGYSIDIVNQAFGTSVKRHQIQTDCYLLAVPGGQSAESLAVEIAARPDVLYCGLNYYLMAPEGLQRSQPFLDVQFDGEYEAQTAVDQLELDVAAALATGEGVRIAIVDGGVSFLHPVFADANLVSIWDYVDGDSVAFDERGGSCSGHGTFVAGVLHLTAPGARIDVYRALDTAGRGTGYDIASALLHAVDNGCRVVNLSLGMAGADDALQEALRYAEGNDVLVVAAAGNDSTDEISLFPFPATRNNCLAVAAVDSVDIKADFSNWGPKVDYCAPGTRLYAPYDDSLYAWWDGTSFAAPFVSAAAALALELDPSLTRDEMDTLLAMTSVGVDSLNPGLEDGLGHGRIRPAVLAQLLAAGTTGDANLDGSIDMVDIIYLVDFIFKNGEPPCISDSGDLNCDLKTTVSDIICLIRYLFYSIPFCS